MRRSSLKRFFVLMFLQVLAANMVHPVTPTFLTNLQMPSFMFGAAFAAMSFTNFLFCPFWGRAGDSFGRIRTLSITIAGYAVGQLIFLFGTTIPQILIARLIAGMFSGGCTVCFMAYVADAAEPEHCGTSMAICAALTSAGTAAGYLVGGIIGDFSVKAAFIVQFSILILVAIGTFIFLCDGPYYQKKQLDITRAINPFGAFIDAKSILNSRMLLFLITVFLACFSSTAYDNSFNYYIKDQFAFPPSYNGYIYAGVGVVGIAVNMTLGLWLQRNTKCRLPLVVIYTLTGVVLFISLTQNRIIPYVAVNMLFYIFNSMYLPLQQALVIRSGDEHDHGKVSGVFSSVRAVGMVTGSLSAGLLYDFQPRLPMAVCACVFLLAAGCGLINFKQYKSSIER